MCTPRYQGQLGDDRKVLSSSASDNQRRKASKRTALNPYWPVETESQKDRHEPNSNPVITLFHTEPP